MAKVIPMLLGGALLFGAGAGRSLGQIPQLGGPPPCACDNIPHEQEHFDSCCQKFIAWLSYQPIKKPGLSSCCCCTCDGCCQPPLYMYFPCMGCDIAMRPCPTCGGAASARILSIHEPASASKKPDPSARILNVEGDEFVVVDRTTTPADAPAPSAASHADSPERTPRTLPMETPGCKVIDRTGSSAGLDLPAAAAKAPTAHIVDVQAQGASRSETNGPDLPFSDR